MMYLKSTDPEKWFEAAWFFLEKNRKQCPNALKIAKLKALQMQVTYGTYLTSMKLAEYSKLKRSEIYQIQEAWNDIMNLTKPKAVRMFLQHMDATFPRWYRSAETMSKFEKKILKNEKIKQGLIQTPRLQKRVLLPNLDTPRRLQVNPLTKVEGPISLEGFSTRTFREIGRIRQLGKQINLSTKQLTFRENISSTLYDIKKLWHTRSKSDYALPSQTIVDRVLKLENENSKLKKNINSRWVSLPI